MEKPFFGLASGYDDKSLLPVRSTKFSAGYDFLVAEDIVVPSFANQMEILNYHYLANSFSFNDMLKASTEEVRKSPYSLEEVAKITKDTGAKPTLVPTGVKAYIPEGYFLQLSVRSSCPLKHWLILANGVGIIDRDYWGNPTNDGHIFFQIINLFPYDIQLHKGDKIGQGIFLPFQKVVGDVTGAERVGGFGSTGA